MPKTLLLLALVSAAAGCQSMLPARFAAGTQPTELVRYGNSIRGREAAALESQYERFLALQASSPSAADSIRLALLMSYPATSFFDVDRARQLLGGVADSGRGSRSETDLAELINHFLSERTCVVPGDAALGELLIAERSRNRTLQDQLVEARLALDAERQLRQTLQGQLDALKALEERLNSRASQSE